MQNFSSKQRKILILFLALFIICIAATYLAERHIDGMAAPGSGENALSGKGVSFSAESGFYDSGFTLKLSAPGASRILYTMDGSDPAVSGAEYSRGIRLSSKRDVNAYVVSACAEYPDGSLSESRSCSYFLSRNIFSRFDCLVFSVSVDPEELYNYEDGIFIAGKMRDEFLEANPELPIEEVTPRDPANWNQRGIGSERKAYVEVYESDGSRVISQPCGLRVVGGFSRGREPQSIRLYARSEYDEVDNRFRYEFFPDARDSQGQIMNSYKRLTLRSCGNDKAGGKDSGYLYMREDLTSFLAHSTGVNAKYSRPAVVFLNGEYHGFVWVQQVFSEDLLDHMYNLEESEWDIFFGGDNKWLPEEENGPWNEVFDDWIRVCDYAFLDLTDDSVYESLCQELDVENFLRYYALTAYVGNIDWPDNNIKMFRYSKTRNAPVATESLSEAAQRICDGRWRFFSYDTDYAFGLSVGLPADEENFTRLFNEKYFNWQEGDETDNYYDCYVRSDLLISLCKREDVRERFLSITCDMMNWHFSPERTVAAMEGFHDWRLQELSYAAAAGKADISTLDADLEEAMTWARQRPEYVLAQLKSIFPDYSDYVSLTVEPAPGAKIYLNTLSLTEDSGGFTGLYPAGTSIPISCALEPGCSFDYWEVNGQRIEQQSFSLELETPEDAEITISLHVSRSPSLLRFSEVCFKGSSRDYFVIHNYGSETVSTEGLYISEGNSDKHYYLPKLILSPGESRMFVCAGYTNEDALGQLQTDFNLKEGETLSLCTADGAVIDSLFLGKCSSGNYLKYCIGSNRFEEYSLENRQNMPEIPGF